ncbi:MAG: 5'-3' exonuclease H3TH domain-containing protein [Chthoniobacterales bacterium]
MRLLLVDAHYFLYRSFFAIRNLRASDGRPTNAIYGYAKALRKMRSDLEPTHAATIWDCGIPDRRMELQPAYKQQRPPMPDDLQAQQAPIEAMCPLLGFHNLSLEKTEADDLIASYAQSAVQLGYEVVVATADKDILQIVAPNIRIYSTSKTDLKDSGSSYALLGELEVSEKWGVPPASIADILALTGDSADNIPGVPGVGQKTAAKLIQQFSTIEKLLAELPEVSNEKLREKIQAASDLLHQNREMVRLDKNIPLPVPIDALSHQPNFEALADFLRNCEFKSLLKEVEKEAFSAATPSQTNAKTPSSNSEKTASAPPPVSTQQEFNL